MARNVEFNEELAIQKAMEVFWEKGYNGTSLRDLTEAMQINSSSLYNTIGDKEQLYFRCIKHYTDIRKSDLKARLSSDSSPKAILIRYVRDATNVILGEGKSCLAIKSAFEIGDSNPAVKQLLKADSDVNYDFLCTLIGKAIDVKEINTQESPEILADFFLSSWTGWYESYILHKDEAKIRAMAAFFIRQIIQ
ncbi:TetR/AcrR family transcriptional regulator [Sphingobacterium corticis]|uniref:TetR/AcrR family transcriptional regulator n=1 Tax=Sphingobacterium corticis TaxID=1812823 RepID=A0ABW5NNF0_9SPHI